MSDPTPREKELQTKLDDANAALRAERDEKAKAAREKRHADAVAFAESLVKSDQLLPAHKGVVVSVLTAVDGEQPVEFDEGGQKVATGKAFRELLQALPKHALNSEHLATKDKGAGAASQDPAAIAQRAVEFQEAQRAKGFTVTTAEAVIAVSADQG